MSTNHRREERNKQLYLIDFLHFYFISFWLFYLFCEASLSGSPFFSFSEAIFLSSRLGGKLPGYWGPSARSRNPGTPRGTSNSSQVQYLWLRTLSLETSTGDLRPQCRWAYACAPPSRSGRCHRLRGERNLCVCWRKNRIT